MDDLHPREEEFSRKYLFEKQTSSRRTLACHWPKYDHHRSTFSKKRSRILISWCKSIQSRSSDSKTYMKNRSFFLFWKISNWNELFHRMSLLLSLLLTHIVYSITDFVNQLNVLVHFELVLQLLVPMIVKYDSHLHLRNFHQPRLDLSNQIIVLLNQLFRIKQHGGKSSMNKNCNIQSSKSAELNVRHKASYCLETRNEA
jgi:hypothetical protein